MANEIQIKGQKAKRGERMTPGAGWRLAALKGKKRVFVGTLLQTFNFGSKRIAISAFPNSRAADALEQKHHWAPDDLGPNVQGPKAPSSDAYATVTVLGSGFVVSDEGYIITAKHVIKLWISLIEAWQAGKGPLPRMPQFLWQEPVTQGSGRRQPRDLPAARLRGAAFFNRKRRALELHEIGNPQSPSGRQPKPSNERGQRR
jgi:hypothetical protein